MTLTEAAALCDVDYNTLYRWVVVKDVIPYTRVGPDQTIRVKRTDVERMIRPGVSPCAPLLQKIGRISGIFREDFGWIGTMPRMP
jgi:excisionase family DNA binding protein